MSGHSKWSNIKRKKEVEKCKIRGSKKWLMMITIIN